jgi:hypothetical protein
MTIIDPPPFHRYNLASINDEPTKEKLLDECIVYQEKHFAKSLDSDDDDDDDYVSLKVVFHLHSYNYDVQLIYIYIEGYFML